jgi:4-hydroxy-tetrahydrodipicolinate reductase
VISVGVVGATGKMGREVCRAVVAAHDLELVAAISRGSAGSTLGDAIGIDGPDGDLTVAERLDALTEAGARVLVDFSGPAFAAEHVAWGVAHGMDVVEGSSGFTVDPGWEATATEAGVGVVIVPNFAIGAVLVERFAREAAAWFDAAEVIELHHDQKVDAPSGTALSTARAIATARDGAWAAPGGDAAYPGARGADVDGVRVHSVRLPGLLAHEEVVFGGPGQTLSLRHDSTDRASFLPGILLAIRAVGDRPGLTLGLEPLLG